MRPPFPAARAPSTWGHWASGRAHAARERGQRGRGQSTDSRASADRHTGGYTVAPRRPPRSRACVPGLWVPRPTFAPRPLSAQTPRPLPRQATGNAVPPPGRSIPEQMPCVSTCPERESGHGCFLWSPPGPPQSLTVHPTSPTPGGTLLGLSCPARAPGSSRRAQAYKPNLAVTGAGTPLRRPPVPSFPVCVPHEATRAGHGEAHRGPCKHVE